MSRKNKGLTLVELAVVMALLALLAVLSFSSVKSWLAAYQAERETKVVLSFLSQARLRALQEKKKFFVAFGSRTLTLYEDTDQDGSFDAATDQKAETLNLKYEITWNGGNGVLPVTERGTFDLYGAGAPGGKTLCWRTVENPSLARARPSTDCLYISFVQVRPGKLQDPAGVCNKDNCQGK
ncbi:prepilin-type N-terminal cleavage/methylation domain-containing protein [Thermosulfurimonas marina]|uniref:Prepilin-type N-terminal cleavage/methylation domain-containing protein n=1 Tax=Thermosulfurimonas marina TaxID=2047767 RepID=A0A6H1WQY1_9BACT|nr:prepilin-type N-terminal cleavage/methylation domain-containing protein [Thermosulfurimonas marina]QJA05625.1 prepilin-type N-terminal cleavage/methylation domain-containing protein [Thermosulfurimonas marina]